MSDGGHPDATRLDGGYPDARVPDASADAGMDASADAAGPPTPALLLHARPAPGSVELFWEMSEGATYDLYRSTDPSCETADIRSCADGARHADVGSPFVAERLQNGAHHSFWLVEEAADGTQRIGESGARPNTLGTDRQVQAVTTLPEGEVVLGGAFSRVGVSAGRGVPFLKRSLGTKPHPAVTGGDVRAAIADGAGGFYIGGGFTHVGGEDRTGLAHILADGTVGDWNPGVDGEVWALHLADGALYVGGDFAAVDDEPRGSVAAFGGDGSLTPWAPNIDGEVYAIDSIEQKLHVAGSFDMIDDAPRSGLAAFDLADDLELLPWAPEVTSSWSVKTLLVGDGVLYVGGSFEGINEASRSGLAAFDAQGMLLPWSPEVEWGEDGVMALAWSDGRLYAGGDIHAVDGAPRACVAIFGSDGGLEDGAPFVLDENDGCRVWSLAADDTGLWVGGELDAPDGWQVGAFAFDTEGQPTGWDPGIDGEVYALALGDDAVFVGGAFGTVASEPRKSLAVLDGGDGRLLRDFPEPGGTVRALEVSDGILYIGGSFNTIDGVWQRGFAAFDIVAGELTDFDPGLVSGDGVHAISAVGDTLYIGGTFTSVDGSPRHRVASFQAEMLTDFAPELTQSVISPQVQAIEMFDGALYVGGRFDEVDGESRTQLAAFVDDELAEKPTNVSSSVVNTLASNPNAILVGGNFSEAGGAPRTHLAAFDADFELMSFDAGIIDGPVSALAFHGGLLYAGGWFGSIDEQPRARIAMFRLPGGASYDVATIEGLAVETMASHDDVLYVGGRFSGVDGRPAANFAMIE
ncbi:MAG: hypothetical protein ACODAU_11685 [Myxococcota bacterium]